MGAGDIVGQIRNNLALQKLQRPGPVPGQHAVLKLPGEIRHLRAPAPGERGDNPVQAPQKVVLNVGGGGKVRVLLEKL
ncbi:hypothetical protein SDC9_85864 [bioreactor metagenome]|uniref:Uncharacterized protein n=1 Tax=bioreactor metagenome TaxID=1076179 RepID=A0A644ZH61_9ZZZZ